MNPEHANWYLIVIVAVITVLAGAAAFYLDAFTTVSSDWWKNVGLVGVGALVGLLTQKAVAG